MDPVPEDETMGGVRRYRLPVVAADPLHRRLADCVADVGPHIAVEQRRKGLDACHVAVGAAAPENIGTMEVTDEAAGPSIHLGFVAAKRAPGLVLHHMVELVAECLSRRIGAIGIQRHRTEYNVGAMMERRV